MKSSRKSVLISVTIVLGIWASCEFSILARTAYVQKIGPDVIIANLPEITRWGTDGTATAFSIGTNCCNNGDEILRWEPNNRFHPVIAQNLYRVKDGRIEQLGQSWLKHGFGAFQLNFCGGCQPHSDFSALGVGCSDPYCSNLNGRQNPLQGGIGGLGSRSEVNASTGVFPWPPRRLTVEEQGIFGGRIRVLNSDLDPTENSNASYFIGAQYVHPDDAEAGNGFNNASFRPVTVNGGAGKFSLIFGGPTVSTEPAIHAWKTVHSDVEFFNVEIEGDGRVIVGLRTTKVQNGFHTDIAIENLNSHQAIRSLAIEYCSSSISNPGFKDVDYHAEEYSGIDWTPNVNSGMIEWSTKTFEENVNANALRWGTLYSFWCDSDSEPLQLKLGLFRPGATSEVTIDLMDSGLLLGDVNSDGVANLLDVAPFVELLSNGDFSCEADINGDGILNLLDVEPFVEIIAS